MTGGTFFARTDSLMRAVGVGVISGRVVVDQVYAKYQELREDLKHPRGGMAHALRESGPAGPHQDGDMQHLAQHAITESGSNLRQAMIDLTEHWSARYTVYAPVQFVNLRRSAHPTVTDDGVNVYDRPPYVHRLSESELKRQRREAEGVDFGAKRGSRAWFQ